MNSKLTNSQPSKTEPKKRKEKQKQTKQTTGIGTDSQKWKSHGGLIIGGVRGRDSRKGTENK